MKVEVEFGALAYNLTEVLALVEDRGVVLALATDMALYAAVLRIRRLKCCKKVSIRCMGGASYSYMRECSVTHNLEARLKTCIDSSSS